MIRKITFLLVAFAFVGSAFAQISFDVKEDTQWVTNTEFDYNLTSYLTNSTEDEGDTTFQWWVSNVDMPEEWDVTVCSGVLCVPNPTIPYDFNVEKDDKVDFKLGFAFYDIVGNGSAWVIAQSMTNPEVMDSFFLAVRAGTASITKKTNNESFKAYPNPVKDKVTVSFTNGGTSKVLIYDILGSLKKSEIITSGSSISVSDLPKGVYVMKLEGDNSFSKVIQKL